MENGHEDDVHCVLNVSTSHADPTAVTQNLDSYLVTGGADKKVRVGDLRKMDNPEPILTLELDEVVLCMDYCPQNPRYLAVGTASGEIDLFDLLAVE
mgnify:CR=1 FL=1